MVKSRNTQFEIKRPSRTRGWGKRASFSIQKVTFDGDKRSQSLVRDNRIDVINRQYAAEDITFEQADQLLKEILAELRAGIQPKGKIVHNSENYKLLDRYWEEDYQFRDVADPRAMRTEMERALDVIGTLSLVSASAAEIQKAIATGLTKVNQQRRTTDRINTLLKFAGRTIKIKKKKAEDEPIRYLNEAEWEKVKAHIDNDIVKAAAEVSFYGSPRLGETFDLVEDQWNGNQLYIKGSMDRKLKSGPTKTRRPRLAYLSSKGFDAMRIWFAIPKAERDAARNLPFAEIVTEACKKVFPNNSLKWLTLRDFRHCYAIYLITRGVSISLVAQSMGNSVKVCQKYYGGFTLVPESVASIKNILAE